MRLIDTVLAWNWTGSRLTLRTPAGPLALTPLAPDLIRLELDATGGNLVLPTGAVVGRDWAPVPAAVAEWGAGTAPATPTAVAGPTPAATPTAAAGPAPAASPAPGLTLTAGRIRAEISFSPLRIDWYDGDRGFAADLAFYVDDGRISVTRALPTGERCYGFGEKTGFLDKRGRRMAMWATDQGVQILTDPLYQSIPFYIGLNDGAAHGFFLDSTARSVFDMGAKEPATTATVDVYANRLDAYVFAGPAMADIVSRYTDLTGRMALPPLWSLGYHQCRYSYYPEARVREVAAAFRERQIPCDAIWLDIDYMDGYRVFTWDRDRFPDPGALTADLAADGFKLVTIVDPGVKVDETFPVYREGVAQKFFCTNPDGSVYVGKVWPGPSAFPDFLQVGARRWWGDHLKTGYLDQGVAGIWNDMNEPANQARNELNEKTLPHMTLQGEEGRKVPHKDVHNAYGFRMGQATFEGLQRHRPDRRPFILTRSGYAGIQRYSAVWTGDNYGWWEGLLDSIPMCLGLGLSGVPFVGADVGGFGDDSTAELFTRWLQLGAFTPFFRGHKVKGSRDHEPWSFGPEAEAINRKYIELRYQLLPYWYSLFAEAAESGLPVMRPLVLAYQDDPETYHISDQFLVGRDLLVAPVYQPGVTRRLVYLPAGDWYDFWTGERHRGKAWIVARAPLDTLPLFVRAGAVLPMWPAAACTAAIDRSQLTLHVYPGEGEFTLYEDAGEGYGPAARTRITVTPDGVRAAAPAGGYTPSRTQVELVIHGPAGAAEYRVLDATGGFTATW